MKRLVLILSLLGTTLAAAEQTDPMRFDRVPIGVDSGALPSPASGTGLVFSDEIEAPGADWIRLWFGPTELPEGATLVVTSARSGAHQVLDAQTLAQWSNSSAYFEGDRVFVDLYVPAGAGESRVVIDSVDAGLPPIAPRTICDGTDLRVLSNDPRTSRLAPQGCTAWLFNNRPNTVLTAHHCGAAAGDVIWFNVPLRTSGGSPVPPPPEHQYAVDGSSLQDGGSWTLGNDWRIFGVFNNSNSGLSPVDAQLRTYVLATATPPADGRPINITGYGTTSFPVPPAWSSVQKSHTGPFFSKSGTVIRYRADTTGGNSGSAVLDEQTGRVIGIHTNGGCGTGSTSSNSGTSIDNTGLRNALLVPRGVAAGPVPAVISLIGEAPDRVEPDGSTPVSVDVLPDFTTESPLDGATLHTNDGSGWVETAMASGFGGGWVGAFPASPCGSTVRYYFSARGADGTPVNFPPGAPGVAFEAVSSEAWGVIAEHDFESADGWTVQNAPGTSGGWERGAPSTTDRRGGPNEDADGSGTCWTTGLGLNVDLTGGPTTLLSPVYDLSGAVDPVLEVSLWMNSDGSSKTLDVSFSSDGGATWTLVGANGPTPGWRDFGYRISDFVSLTSAFRARVVASDLGTNHVIEAGVDAVRIRDVACSEVSCGVADLAHPFGVLDLADVQAFIAGFLQSDPISDLAEPFGVFDLQDVEAFLDSFGLGCP